MEFVEPGAVLGQTILDDMNRPLLKEGTILTSSYINRLKAYGYTSIYLNDPLTYDISIEEFVPRDLKTNLLAGVRKVFTEVRKSSRLDSIMADKTVYALVDLFKDVLDAVSGDTLFELHMGSILNKDSGLLEHSFNVALFSTIIASASGLNATKIKDIGIGALLHDIGKIVIPESILNKAGPLSPEEWVEIKKHPLVGYDIIRKQSAFSVLSAHCALQHHERLDGTGYPRSLKGDEIHLVGKITGIADVFEAMTAPRPYKKPILPGDVMEYLFTHSQDWFDPELIELFRSNIALYPLGVNVQLSDGHEGVVMKNTKNFASRPQVRVTSFMGSPVSPYDLDLATVLNVTITGSTQTPTLSLNDVANL